MAPENAESIARNTVVITGFRDDDLWLPFKNFDLPGETSLKSSGLLTALLTVALGSGLWVPVRAGELRAGAAKVSITPTPDEFPYTIGRERSFVGVHDEVFARALVLDNGTTRVAIVVAEVTAVPDAKRIVDEVAQAVGVPASNVIVTASHTHESLAVFIHGTDLLPVQLQEIDHIRAGAVAAARQAVKNLQPARIAFARGEAFVNINNGEQAGLKTWYDAKGPSDKGLGVVRVESTKGEPLALVVNYATHAETLFRSVVKDDGYLVSGDIPGAVSRTLESNAAGAPVVVYMAGAEADQLPLFKSLQPEAGGLPAADEGMAGFALLNVLARRLSGSVLETLGHMPAGVSNVTLKAAANSVTCPGQRIRVDNKTGEITKQEAPAVAIPLAAIRINNIGIAAIGGDVGSDIGQQIRTAAGVPNMMVASQLAGTVGYILSDAAYEHPGHGISGSTLKEGCAGPALSKGIADLLK